MHSRTYRKVVSMSGMQNQYYGRQSNFHLGLDILCLVGTITLWPSSGVAAYIGYSDRLAQYGCIIELAGKIEVGDVNRLSSLLLIAEKLRISKTSYCALLEFRQNSMPPSSFLLKNTMARLN